MNLRLEAAQFPIKLGIHGLQPIVDARGDIYQVTRGPNPDRHAPSRRRGLRDWEVNERPQILFGIALAEVGDDTHNFPLRRGGIRKSNVIADWIGSREKVSRESLIDDGYRAARLAISLVERTAGKHRHLESREIFRAHGDEPDFFLNRWHFGSGSFDSQLRTVRTVHRERVRDAHGLDTGELAQALRRLVHEASAVRWGGVARKREASSDRENVVWVIA